MQKKSLTIWGARRWSFCYQLGLPRLVSRLIQHFQGENQNARNNNLNRQKAVLLCFCRGLAKPKESAIMLST